MITRGRMLGYAHRIRGVVAHMREQGDGTEADRMILLEVAQNIEDDSAKLRVTAELPAVDDDEERFASAETMPLGPRDFPEKK